jgi:hypothetical protein
MDSPRFFSRRDDWQMHMSSAHCEDWTRREHLDLWYCDLEHKEEEDVEFSNEALFRAHLQDTHEEDAETVEAFVARRIRRGILRLHLVCPLCESKSGTDGASLLEHIGDELESVSLLALPRTSLELDDFGEDQDARCPPQSDDPPSSIEGTDHSHGQCSKHPGGGRCAGGSRCADGVLWRLSLADLQIDSPQEVPGFHVLVTEAEKNIELSRPIGPLEPCEATEISPNIQRLMRYASVKRNTGLDDTYERFRKNFLDSFALDRDFRHSTFTGAMKTLGGEQQQILRKLMPANADSTDVAIKEVHACAKELQKRCAIKRWSWNYRGRQVYLSEQVDKILQLLDKFKAVGDIIANADLVHVDLPWAGIRAILEVCIQR